MCQRDCITECPDSWSHIALAMSGWESQLNRQVEWARLPFPAWVGLVQPEEGLQRTEPDSCPSGQGGFLPPDSNWNMGSSQSNRQPSDREAHHELSWASSSDSPARCWHLPAYSHVSHFLQEASTRTHPTSHPHSLFLWRTLIQYQTLNFYGILETNHWHSCRTQCMQNSQKVFH